MFLSLRRTLPDSADLPPGLYASNMDHFPQEPQEPDNPTLNALLASYGNLYTTMCQIRTTNTIISQSHTSLEYPHMNTIIRLLLQENPDNSLTLPATARCHHQSRRQSHTMTPEVISSPLYDRYTYRTYVQTTCTCCAKYKATRKNVVVAFQRVGDTSVVMDMFWLFIE